MLFAICFICIAGLIAVLCGADHIIARFAVIASVIVGFAMLSVPVIAVETMMGLHKIGFLDVFLGDLLVFGILVLRAIWDKGLFQRLGRFWTPKT